MPCTDRPGRSRPCRAHRIALLVPALAVLASCEAGGSTVVFGLAGPFSEGYGQSMQQGAEMAAREINANGGIRGRRLELRTLDDRATPEGAVQVAERLFADPGVVAVAGHVNSGAMIEAAGIYSRGLPALATSATSPEISRLGPWVFRVASSDSANAVALARAIASSAATTAILYENDSYGRGLSESFRNAAEAGGVRVIETSPYLASTADFSPYLERMRSRGVETVFIAGLEDGAARIISQARDLGLGIRFIGGDGLEGLSTLGPLYDGTEVGLLFHAGQSPRARAFGAAFLGEYGREADSFAALGYDAVHLLARAASEAGIGRERIRAYLERVGAPGGRPAFDGVAGTVRFDANGDPEAKDFAIGIIADGRIVLQRGAR
jgi:branched-chain amino acid transport system substrate-binding protein